MRSAPSTLARRMGLCPSVALTCNETLYVLPAVNPLMVVFNDPPALINATLFPSGIVPLLANELSPPAGLRPAAPGLSVVHPLMGALSLISPGATEKLFASKLGLGMVWPLAQRG